MVNLYKHPGVSTGKPHLHSEQTGKSYSTYQEPDTKVPPKALPVMKEISVDGVAIAEADILAEAQNHPAENPGEALREAARSLVIRQLLLGEAERLGIEAEAEIDPAGRKETHNDAAIRALVADQVQAPKASDVECQRYYETNLLKFSSEPIFEARHILVPKRGEGLSEDARKLAAGICDELAGKPSAFNDLAKAYSVCPSKDVGGNLGQLTKGSTVAEFEAAMMGMDEGAITPTPVESRFGFHVIALDRKVPGKQLPYEMVRDRIAAWLEAQAWSRAVAQYIGILAGQASIKGIDIAGAESPLVQ